MDNIQKSHSKSNQFMIMIKKHKKLITVLAILIVMLLVMIIINKLASTPYKLVIKRDNTLYQYEKVKKEDLTVYCQYALGKKEQIYDFEIEDPILYDKSTDIYVKYKNISEKVSVACKAYEKTYIEYEFPDTVYQGDSIDRNKLKVQYIYESGDRRDQDDYKILNNEEYFNSNKLEIETSQGISSIKCDNYIEANGIKKSDGKAFTGDKLNNDYLNKLRFVISYKDKTTKTIDIGDITIDDEVVLQSGNNDVQLNYHGNSYNVEIKAVDKKYTIEVKYDSSQYVGDSLAFDKLLINYEDGTFEELEKADISINGNTELKYGKNKFTFNHNGQTMVFEVDAIEHDITSANLVEYNAYIGSKLDIQKINIQFDNGETREVKGSELKYDCDITQQLQSTPIEYHGQTFMVEFTAVEDEIVSVKVDKSVKFYAGTNIPDCKFTITYASGNKVDVMKKDLQFSIDTLQIGDNNITVTYKNKSCDIVIKAIDKSITSTTCTSGNKFFVGDSITDVILNIVYSDGTSEDAHISNLTITKGDVNNLSLGDNVFEYSYNNRVGTFTITAYELDVIDEQY